MSSCVIELSTLTVRYGRAVVLRDISTTIVGHGITLLLGDNGAGKSTLLRVISGLKRAASGTIKFLDQENRSRKAKVSLSCDTSMLYGALSVRENLELFCKLSPGTCSIEEEIERWQIFKLLGKRINQLSRGEQARVQLALAFAQSCDFILLDEPTNALDQPGRAALLSALKVPRSSSGIVVATHDAGFFTLFSPSVLTLRDGAIEAGSNG